MIETVNDMLADLLEEKIGVVDYQLDEELPTKEELEASRKEWQEKNADLIREISKSEQLTEADFAIRINTVS